LGRHTAAATCWATTAASIVTAISAATAAAISAAAIITAAIVITAIITAAKGITWWRETAAKIIFAKTIPLVTASATPASVKTHNIQYSFAPDYSQHLFRDVRNICCAEKSFPIFTLDRLSAMPTFICGIVG
jgi:hypothetical protein